MNICMAAYTVYDSDGRVRRYAEEMAQRGHSVDVMALRRDDQPKQEEMKGVTVYRMQKFRAERNKWSYLFRYSEFLLRSFLFITINHFKKKYRLVHIHSIPDFEVFAALVPKLAGAKIILDIHDMVPEFFLSKFGTTKESKMYRLLILAEKISCRFADHVIISNHLWKKDLISRSVKPEKCTAIINYPDAYFFEKGDKNRENGKMVLMYPGTLIYHQGIDLAIEAFSRIVNKFPEAEFHIYGGGPEADKLEQLVENLNLLDKVKFCGRVKLDVVAREIETASIGIVPKRADNFGDRAFSTKILEFMAKGVPVLISKTTIDQFYFNDEIATFFEPGNIEDLSKKMEKLMSDEGLRVAKAAKAEIFAQENSWTEKKSEYLNLVTALVGKS